MPTVNAHLLFVRTQLGLGLDWIVPTAIKQKLDVDLLFAHAQLASGVPTVNCMFLMFCTYR